MNTEDLDRRSLDNDDITQLMKSNSIVLSRLFMSQDL